MNKQEKGRLLEDGLAAIERHILQCVGGLAPEDFVIESRKIIRHAGARHEADLRVTVKNPAGYDSVFIFECKNWRDKVDKNQIMLFSQKIDLFTAQRGFFVGTHFTKDALAVAATDPRMVMLTASADEASGYEAVADLYKNFYFYISESISPVIDLYAQDADQPTMLIDHKSADATLDGQRLDLEKFMNDWSMKLADTTSHTWDPPIEPDATKSIEATETRTYAPGQFIVNGVSFIRATITTTVSLRVELPPVRAKVEVGGRGIAFKLEPIVVGGGQLDAWLLRSKVSKS